MQKNETVKLYAISIDPPEISKEFAAKLAADGQGEIKFPLLSDPDHRTIDAYGLRDPAYDEGKFAGIPHAAVYVIDKKGIVRWAKVESNYRERPANEKIRKVLDALR